MFTILEIFRDSRYYPKFVAALAWLLLVHLVGIAGFTVIGGERATLVDSLYMTFTTVATIGFGEIYDMAGNPGARIFTMFIAFFGIGGTWYLFSTFTAFVLETNLNEAYRRRRMLRKIDEMKGHYIVCGIGRVGTYVADELIKTERPFVVIDSNTEMLAAHEERTGHELQLHGDAADDEVLLKAGVQRAAGVFAVTGDDSRNLVVSMSVRQLNPVTRIVARVHDKRNVEKTRRAGADEIVSPDFTGGMRIASAMLRPHAVNFMDMMLRTANNLRVEEIPVPPTFGPRPVSTLAASREFLLVAIKGAGESWNFNPGPEDAINPGDRLVAIVSPNGRRAVEAALAPA